MIGKGRSVSTANSTANAIDYGWNQEKDATVVLKQNLLGQNPKEITNEFKVIQNMNPKCKKNMLSFILSPTIDDGQKLTDKKFGEIAERFIKEMKLTNHQAIAFIHKDKAHRHLHIYCNKIDFSGKTFSDSFIGKRANYGAEKVAKSMGLKTVKDVQNEKLKPLQKIRSEIRSIHIQVLKKERPKTFDAYIKKMAVNKVKVIPSINKGGTLQGFRFEYNGINLKGSEVHRSMSGGKIANEIAANSNGEIVKNLDQAVNIAGKTLELSTNMITGLAKKAIKQTITKGIEIGI